MRKSKNMIAYEKFLLEQREALIDFFVAWEEEQWSINHVRSKVSSVKNGSTRVANAYHDLSPAEKKKVK
jgi:hypothetical protein